MVTSALRHTSYGGRGRKDPETIAEVDSDVDMDDGDEDIVGAVDADDAEGSVMGGVHASVGCRRASRGVAAAVAAVRSGGTAGLELSGYGGAAGGKGGAGAGRRQGVAMDVEDELAELAETLLLLHESG